ncbi:MAG: acetyl-CoA carboxylase biotin carboxylase subunit [Dehalococcoidia bacterium]|nr:acetyl-CoA carboxylase biotin carboxylase subunit [Dehalococcoidia bacterium]
MFTKLLVANRGEIALRVLRACRDLGIAGVAVYSEADRDSLHVRYADEAYLIGPGPAGESYLKAAKILEVARKARVDAIHPGYGFLAENADFAQACRENRITFVGPSPECIRLLGDKMAARRLMGQAGIPVVPGSKELTTADTASPDATRIGYPLLVKAATGGGGKGIRAVYRPEELPIAMEVASREAGSAFGDGGLYLEKFLETVRHVEVQIIGDHHGNVVALGERECSIQRRYQKMIEEAPSTAVDEALRQRLMEMAVRAGKAADYVNVGTVEFLLDEEGNPSFLEVNTRLQVEHPVTELVMGVDLVADQILVAEGEALSYRQGERKLRGWAIECRISAEDPFNEFLPSVGRVSFVSEPGGPSVRVDSALYNGTDIPHYYDPLIAKLSTWGRDRAEAIQRMRRALQEFKIVGISTNIPFHLQVMDNVHFIAGALDTTFVDKHFRLDQQRELENEEIALIAASLLAHGKKKEAPSSSSLAAVSGDPWRLQGRRSGLRERDWGMRRMTWRKST